MKEQETTMLEIIYDARQEELSAINKRDKKFINQDNISRNKKRKYLNNEIAKIPYNLSGLRESIKKALDDYVVAIDDEGTYFNKKHYLEGFKDGIKIKEELK